MLVDLKASHLVDAPAPHAATGCRGPVHREALPHRPGEYVAVGELHHDPFHSTLDSRAWSAEAFGLDPARLMALRNKDVGDRLYERGRPAHEARRPQLRCEAVL